jgi:hypothetical protein
MIGSETLNGSVFVIYKGYPEQHVGVYGRSGAGKTNFIFDDHSPQLRDARWGASLHPNKIFVHSCYLHRRECPRHTPATASLHDFTLRPIFQTLGFALQD